jgi:hypothetical protein
MKVTSRLRKSSKRQASHSTLQSTLALHDQTRDINSPLLESCTSSLGNGSKTMRSIYHFQFCNLNEHCQCGAIKKNGQPAAPHFCGVGRLCLHQPK